MKISAVISTFNGLKILKKNLPAVLECLRNNDELIIVDDASQDKSFEWLKKKFGLRVNFIPESTNLKSKMNGFVGRFQSGKKEIRIAVYINKKNSRFGESVNRGVRLSCNSFVLVMNNDVSPKKNILKFLMPYFKVKNVFGVGLMENELVVVGKEKKVVSSGKNKLWFEKGLFFHDRAENFESGDTAWVSGGSGLFDKEKWLKLGGFDVSYYPAYWEDIDLSFRARKNGWKVLFEKKAVVDHNHETTNKTVFGQKKIEKISWKNADRFVWKNGSFWQKIAFVLWRPYWWWKRPNAMII